MDSRQENGMLTGKISKHPHPEHMQYVRKAAADGMVLLKNENQLLPMAPKKIALFGAGATDTVFCGTGSGYVFAPYTVSIYEGLKNAGFEITSKAWLERFEKASEKANKEDKTLTKINRMWSGLKILIGDLEITHEELSESKTADTVIYVVRRNAGESDDRKSIEGDYYLSKQEKENIVTLAKHFEHTIIVLNTCAIDGNFVFDIPGVEAVILMGYSGNEGGNSLADVITGKVSPAGRLTDTWAKQYSDYPASATFADHDGDSMQEDYTEDIFVGYRYFDTFDKEVLFPFGYGLGYGKFKQKVIETNADWNEIQLKVEVENIGAYPDREVVQVYVSAPEGDLSKPYQELKGFAKTKTLKSGEKEIVEIRIPTESLASYDTASASFVMEEGKYDLRVGNHSRNTMIAAAITLDKKAVVRKVVNRMSKDHEIELLKPTIGGERMLGYKAKGFDVHTVFSVANPVKNLELQASTCQTIEGYHKWYERTEEQQKAIKPAANATFLDVKTGKVSMEDFVASLDEEVLFRLVTGNANETEYEIPSRNPGKLNEIAAPMSSGATTGLFMKSLGIPMWYLTDGPAGLHLPYCGTTCNPVGMVLAQTWDEDICTNIGIGIGKELRAYNYSVILGPGLNIHRDPLCGRNFEYYSEDPLISGKIAAAATRGVQSTPGTSVSIKHFACNNQETNRSSQNSTVSERALREIYLKGFEICVREANPNTVMSSYNCINGLHTSSNKELLIDILRDEWGFQGLVMTDWGTQSKKDQDLCAGNNLIMGGYRSQFLKSAYLGNLPDFTDDGYVVTDEFKVYGGFLTETIEHWNAFVLDKNGKDEVSVIVKADRKMNEKVQEKIQEGVAKVESLSDGSRKITYFGKKQGATLPRRVLEQNVCVVLQQILNSVSFEVMTK